MIAMTVSILLAVSLFGNLSQWILRERLETKIEDQKEVIKEANKKNAKYYVSLAEKNKVLKKTTEALWKATGEITGLEEAVETHQSWGEKYRILVDDLEAQVQRLSLKKGNLVACNKAIEKIRKLERYGQNEINELKHENLQVNG